MDSEILYWIALNEIKGVGNITARRFLKQFNTPKSIFAASLEELASIKGIGEKTSRLVLDSKKAALEKAENIMKSCEKYNINILSIEDELYPKQVSQLSDSPIILYYSGSINKRLLGVGIVGTRRCSEYGKRVTKEAAEFLAENSVTVVSGLAKGIDGYAHSACINAKGYTIAFLGSGIDYCYPREHLKLMEKIKETGLVLSEYAPGIKPQAINFPRRNRLIAAFSHKLLVVEAGESSGALITVGYAKKYEREIFAVPDNIYARQSMGSNKLILEGASIYLTPEQLITQKENKLQGEGRHSREGNMKNRVDRIEQIVLDALADNPKTLEELRVILNREDIDLLEKISLLELEGEIKVTGGKIKRMD